MTRASDVENFLRKALGDNQNNTGEDDPKIVFNAPVTINIGTALPAKKEAPRPLSLDQQALQSGQANGDKLARLPPPKWT